MTPAESAEPRRRHDRRNKTAMLLRAARTRPLQPRTPGQRERFDRLTAQGLLVRVSGGWMHPEAVEQARERAEVAFDFEAHRRRFDHF